MQHFKSDLHLHTSDDRNDLVEHSALELFTRAARDGFRVLAITNHDTFSYSLTLQRAAADLGILLIPGIERQVEGKHVLILNAYPATEKINTFAELRQARDDGVFVIAPHPFFKASMCLENKLLEHLELFDAIEHSFFYSRLINFNKKAIQLCKNHGLPLVGNSDCHMIKYFGVCHSVIQADVLDMETIFQSIRDRRLEVVTKPMSSLGLCRYAVDNSLTRKRLRRARNEARDLRAPGKGVVIIPQSQAPNHPEQAKPPARAAQGARR